ncbi:MAG: hypothetical protein M1812_001168 [Candelaria pacifica]|nr:MAG: hypothetical protein M1812_001168 [Candelaria pacifica]
MADPITAWTWSPAHNQYYYPAFVNGNWEYTWQYPELLNQATTDSRTPRVVADRGADRSEASQPREGYQNEPEAEDTELLDNHPTGSNHDSRYNSGHNPAADYSSTWGHYAQQTTDSGLDQYSTTEGDDLATQAEQLSLESRHDYQESGPRDNEYTLSNRTTSSRGKSNRGYSASTQGEVAPQEEKLVVRSKHIAATNGEVEKLDKAYKRIKKAPRFFTRGRVFMMLWTEPTSSYATSDTWITQTRFEENAFSAIRRFVVVKESDKHCLCVPITTYGGQGATKRGIRQGDHAIIFTGDKVPQYLEGEDKITKDALQVIPDSPDAILDLRSRVNFGKIYTVEHNVKVKTVGLVAPGSMTKLKRYYEQIMLDD